jgi:predicted metalloprotease with PDZ domain
VTSRTPLVLSFLLIASVGRAEPSETLRVRVDAREAPRRLLHSDLSFPVRPGPLTLHYPRCGLPTYCAPDTVVDNIVGLSMSVGGRPITWQRDLVDPLVFRVVVPDDGRQLDVALDVVAPPARPDLNAATGQLMILDWPLTLIYPAEVAVDTLAVEARLRLPAGWRAASALAATEGADGELVFAPAALATLVDSPVLAGKHFVSVDLPTGAAPPVTVAIAADVPAAAALPDAWRDRFTKIVTQAGALFGGFPYRRYHFLVSLSDALGNDGMEHRESADLHVGLGAFRDDANRRAYGYLFPHEFVHAWNGLYRLGVGMISRDYRQRETSELQWVYEGLTRYLNWVLAGRADVLSPDEAHEYVAFLAAKTAHRPGRAWRSLADTAISATILNDAPNEWESLRRSTDYYDEMLLVWLEADVMLRKQSAGRSSLDDFCRTFFSDAAPPPAQRPYGFDDVVAALDRVAPHDWAAFLRERLDAIGADRAPLAGIGASGWSLEYSDRPNSVQAARDEVNKTVEERFSIGLLLGADGTAIDVLRDSAAWKAGMGPSMRVVRVDGRPWSATALRAAVARDRGAKLRLTVRNGAETFEAQVDDQQGPRYPHLVRASGEDLIEAILRPRARP